MEKNKLKISYELLFRILFHLIFWFYWLALPMINAQLDEETQRINFLKKLFPATLACIPFFYFNSEILIKRFLPKGKISNYIFSLFILFVVFLASQYFLKIQLIDKPVRIYDTRTLFPVLFILSMSTLYGFLIFMVSQSKLNKEKEDERVKSELSFLRSQISPHFIFNILNSIVYLIRNDQKGAEKVTLELSNLIRYMLYESEHKQVTLGKEIEYLNNYIKLQVLRFGDDVKIHNLVEIKNSNLMIEPMLLIPFVENAFKHGVNTIENPEISIELKNGANNDLFFSVKNAKSGVKLEMVDDSGIGLKNVKRRIELLYESNHDLIIEETEKEFKISLSLKLKNI